MNPWTSPLSVNTSGSDALQQCKNQIKATARCKRPALDMAMLPKYLELVVIFDVGVGRSCSTVSGIRGNAIKTKPIAIQGSNTLAIEYMIE